MRLRWTPEAVRNLEEIYEYLEHEMPDRARPTILQIQREIAMLRQFPLLGRPLIRIGVRAICMKSLPYVCVYTQRHGAVILLHIYHASQKRPIDLQ